MWLHEGGDRVSRTSHWLHWHQHWNSVDINKKWETPSTLTVLRGFVGLLQIFERVIKNISEIAAPFTNVTRKGGRINKWNENCDIEFAHIKHRLTSAPILKPPDWNQPFRFQTVASQFVVGGKLSQLDEKSRMCHIIFFQKVQPSWGNLFGKWPRGIRSLVYCLRRFHCYLEGSSFDVYTENQIIKNFFTKPSLSRRETRLVEFISQFEINGMIIKKGNIHVLGDALYRLTHTLSLSHNSNVEMIQMKLSHNFESNLSQDATFGHILRAMNGELPQQETNRLKI